MKRINLNFELTWRDIAWRVALVLAVVAVIVWFMPRDHRPNFKFEQGKPWNYADMTATFDFPVYKSDSVVKAEQEAALKDYEPYYTYDAEVGPEQVRRFMQQFGRDQKGLSSDYKRIIANRLNACYAQGIVDTKSPSGLQLDSTAMLRRVDGKDAVSVAVSSVFTGLEVYELLLSDPDEERSDQSRIDLMNSVTRASGVVLRGQKIIDRGDIVDESTSRVLQSYLTEIDKRHQGDRGISSTVMGELLYVLLVVLGFTVYLTMYRKDYFDDMRSVAMLYTLLVLFAVLASILVEHNVLHVYILPFAIVPIFVRVFMDSRTAFMAHTALVLICACILQHPLEFIAVEMAAGLAAIFSLRELSSRSQLFWTATLVTLVAMLTNLSLFLIRSGDFSRIDTSEYYFLLVCGIVIFCSYPLLYIVERTFGFVSNITLIELSDMNKELLRRMSEVAPGTFQHSIQVGNLAAEIARKIGANAQLVRTGALYHDIGKTQNPIYFTENQSGGISPHDHLSLIESAQMIVSHVTEGLKLADHYNLPQQIRDFISTHHGLGKAKYFFIKYKNEHPDEPVDDLLFTYPGPNPFTKEQAVLMMADAVEAASRSLPDYTEQSIRQLVGRIIDSQVQEGYFRDCPITFRDIAYAKTVLIEKLKTIYHTRISYPEAKA